jgi:hypothetical protein
MLASNRKDRVYDEYYCNVPIDSSNDRIFKSISIRIHTCDICDDMIEDCPDDIERQILILKEIDDSFESVKDKQEPRLLLCDYCKKEYLIPRYN